MEFTGKDGERPRKAKRGDTLGPDGELEKDTETGIKEGFHWKKPNEI